MRNLFRTPFFCVPLALGLFAAPLSVAAQQSPQDFTLPEPTPSNTPVPQGPVDDTGIIPVGPRVIPTATPTPTAVPTTAPIPAPAASPTAAPTRTPASSTPPATGAARPAAPSPVPALQEPAVTVDQPAATGSPLDLPALPGAEAGTATPLPPVMDDAATPAGERAFPWVYAIGGILALLALAAGWAVWRRRRENTPPPAIKRPVVDAALDQVGSSALPPRYDVSFEVEGITRSLMAVMVAGRIVVKNRGERAIRDVALLAELTSAHHPSAKTPGNLHQIGTIERIGPHQSHREKINLRLPLDQVAGMRRDGVPFFVPLLRLEAAVEGTDPQRLDLVLGTLPPGAGHKLQPLRLDGPPGAYEHLRGHALTA